MRLTIRNHNQEFLNRIANQMGVEPIEALNYLLIELRRINYSFSSNLPEPIKKSPVTAQESNSTEMLVEGSTGSLMSALVESGDPILNRLLNAGLELDF